MLSSELGSRYELIIVTKKTYIDNFYENDSKTSARPSGRWLGRRTLKEGNISVEHSRNNPKRRGRKRNENIIFTLKNFIIDFKNKNVWYENKKYALLEFPHTYDLKILFIDHKYYKYLLNIYKIAYSCVYS